MNATDFEYAIKKDVRNNPIVRELDEERQRQLWRSTVVGGMLVLVLLFSAWQQFELVRHGYRMEELQKARAAQEEINRRLRLEIDLGDADAELGLDRPQRLVGAHQAPPRERLAHVREIHDVILLAGGDMQEIELRLGGERDPQRVDEGLGAGVGEVGRMEDGADLHADEMPGIASGSLA